MQIQTENVLYLIGGPNGSGKTTLVEQLFGKNPTVKFVNADNIAREHNLCPISSDTGRVLFDEMDAAFSSHASFIYETTLSGKSDNKIIKRAKDAGYSIEFFYVILSSVKQNIARVKSRYDKGGHNVPENVVVRRHKKSLFNFDTVYKQSDHWQVYDNAGAECTLFATGVHDVVNVVDEGLYNMFIQNKQHVIAEYLADLERRRALRIERMTTSLSK
jgi:predicted ABC-type ATPase